ncbi:SKP1-interacting partner 15 [Linum grandiflorum]
MDESPMNRLPHDTLHQIFSTLPLRQIATSRSVCRFLHQTLTSPSFLSLLATSQPPLSLLALRPPPTHHLLRLPPPPPSFPAFDPILRLWLDFPLSFLPFRSLLPVASSSGLVYLWASDPSNPSDPSNSSTTTTASAAAAKSLVACNPLTRRYCILPSLGSAWSRHGAVLADSGRVIVLMEPAAALYSPDSTSWVTFASNLPSKARSPVLISDSLFALCDVGSPWRAQWKLYTCALSHSNRNNYSSSCYDWVRLEKHEWADIFDLIKRPRLVRGKGRNKLLMIGGLKSTFSLNTTCSTMLILRLDLEKLEWEEAGRMPVEMYRCFVESKLKVFGDGDKVCFSAKRVVGKLALWDGEEDEGNGGEVWRWIDGVPGTGDGICRGFIYDARLTASA